MTLQRGDKPREQWKITVICRMLETDKKQKEEKRERQRQAETDRQTDR